MNTRISRIAIVGAAIVVALLVAGVIAVGTRRESGGSPPQLDVPQKASASDQGITLTVRAAAFSGTETFVEVFTDLSGIAEADRERVLAIGVPQPYFSRGNIHPAGDVGATPLRPDGSSILHFGPIPPTGPVTIRISGIELYFAGDQKTSIPGDWTLSLEVPANRAELLRVEELAASSPASDGGVTVSVIGAVRSRTETRVTVEIDGPPGVAVLGQPAIISEGQRLLGIEVGRGEGGRVVTFSFPETAFGTDATIIFDAFVAEAEGAGFAWVDVDVGSALLRSGIAEPVYRAVAEMRPADVRAVAGWDPQEILVRQVEFGGNTEVTDPADLPGAPPNIVLFQVSGQYNLTPGGSPFAIRYTDGSVVEAVGSGENFLRDASGAVVEAVTTVTFLFDSPEQLYGVVRIMNKTDARQLIRGEWAVALQPIPE
ncbi:MAG: hypothetical protein Kow0010_17950 [Dehalococcoidia bacterium]